MNVGATKPAVSARRYALLRGTELQEEPSILWTVKNLVPQQGLALVYGASGSGKSFLLLDLACAVAEGLPWFGHATTRAPVVYLCLEGAAGLVGRIRVWSAARGRAFPDLVRWVREPFSLLDGHDVDALARSVRGWTRTLHPGCGAPVIIIDTLNRAMQGGDENLSADMGAILEACAALSTDTGGLTLLVHHIGKDTDRGPRGHSSLMPAVDFALLVSRSGKGRSWEVKKLKDGADGTRHAFELETVSYGVDADGEALSSCVVRPLQDDQEVEGAQLPVPVRNALRTMQGLLPLASRRDDSSTQDTVALDEWRTAFCQNSSAPTDSGKRVAFKRAKDALIDGGYATLDGELLRLSPVATSYLGSLAVAG